MLTFCTITGTNLLHVVASQTELHSELHHTAWFHTERVGFPPEFKLKRSVLTYDLQVTKAKYRHFFTQKKVCYKSLHCRYFPIDATHLPVGFMEKESKLSYTFMYVMSAENSPSKVSINQSENRQYREAGQHTIFPD